MTFSTDGYGGITVKETVKIHTNDTAEPIIELLMTGEVRKFVILEPAIISLKGKAGESIVAQMKIVPNVQDFDIRNIQVKDGTHFTYDIEKLTNDESAFFELTVKNTKQAPGRYFDLITIEPDLLPARSIRIRVSANIFK